LDRNYLTPIFTSQHEDDNDDDDSDDPGKNISLVSIPYLKEMSSENEPKVAICE
jgi:hypothetical protein